MLSPGNDGKTASAAEPAAGRYTASAAVRGPHPALRAQLASGYTGWSRPNDRVGRFVLPASMSVDLVLKVEDSVARPPEFVQGVQTGYSVIDGGCAPTYIEIGLSPLGAYQLLGIPMSQLAGQLVDFADVIGHEGRRLGDVVRDRPTWRGRFTALDQFFLTRMDAAPTVAPEVRRAWYRLVATGGTVPIRTLCREVGWSHKHLITRFRHHVGVTPKQAGRVIRFERVLGRMSASIEPDWGRVAADCGYADQAHLIRDFGEFAGTTPGARTRSAQQANFLQSAGRDGS